MDRLNIPDLWAKCKTACGAAIGDWGLIGVVFLVAFGSFALGRLSATEVAKSAISVSTAPVENELQGMVIGGLVVASRNGEVYHYPWCGGASQINPANKIWFADEEAAQKAGYRPSKSCKGLDSR